jgi:hypothetical protein
MLGSLVFELCHPGQFAEHGIAREDPAQFRMVVDMALDKDQTLFRIDAGSQEKGKSFQGLPAQVRRVLTDGQGMKVRNEIIAVIIFLELPPVPDCPDIVAQRENARRLNPAEDNFLFRRFLFHRCCGLFVRHNESPFKEIDVLFVPLWAGEKTEKIHSIYYTLFSRRTPVFPTDSLLFVRNSPNHPP